jgi:uncharacterized protein (TIGR03435 family)
MASRFLLIALVAGLAFGQSFDVASVKSAAPPESGRKGPNPFQVDPMFLAVRHSTLKRIMQHAYGVEEYQIFGLPAWADEDRFDIEAKTEQPVSADQMMKMLRTLLAERFRLAIHHDSKSVAIGILSVAKDGPKFGPQFHPVKPGDSRPPRDPSSLNYQFQGTLDHFVMLIAENVQMHDPAAPAVRNQTGLEGDYAITLTPKSIMKFAADWAAALEPIGLRLEERKTPMDVLVIDHADKPSAN